MKNSNEEDAFSTQISQLGPMRPSSDAPYHVLSLPFSHPYSAFLDAWSWLFCGITGGEVSFFFFPVSDDVIPNTNPKNCQCYLYHSTNSQLEPLEVFHLHKLHSAVFTSRRDPSFADDLFESSKPCLNQLLSYFSDITAFRSMDVVADIAFVCSPNFLTLKWNSSLFDDDLARLLFFMINSKITNYDLPFSILNSPCSDLCLNSSSLANYLHGCFYHNTLSHPYQDALKFIYEIGDDLEDTFRSFSFLELHSLAIKLSKLVTCKNEVVPIMVSHSPALFVGILAILYSGNAYCPIDVETRTERVHFISKDVDASFAIVSEEFVNRFPNNTIILKVPEYNESMEIKVDDEIPPFPFPESLDSVAYVLYTSGSTGNPKGVAISHRAATNSIKSHGYLYPMFGLERGDAWLQFANVTFDVSVFEIFGNWNNGLTLVTSKRQNLIGNLEYLIYDYKIAALELTPTVANVISLDENKELFTSVRMLITIGELLTNRIIDFWGERLVNAYGPTEAAIHVTLNPSKALTTVYLVGVPLQSATICVVSLPTEDSQPHVLHEGFLGEVCIAGPQLSSGYINRPEINAKAFVEVQYNEQTLSIYRTGDLGRIINGKLYIFGRIAGDMQIKIRGRRIEIGEIESKLAPSVDSLAIEKIGDNLVAFYVGDEMKLRKHAESHLASWMCPTKYVGLPGFPRLASGKTDRKALKIQFSASDKHSTDFSSFNQSELLVANVLHEICEKRFNSVVSISRFSSIFDLGLDSLDIVYFVRKIRSLGFEANPSIVLTSKVVFKIAESLILLKPNEVQSKNNFLNKCTPLQKGMLYESFSNNGNLYFNHTVFKIAASPEKVKLAWEKLLDTHTILSNGFALDENEGFTRFILEKKPPLYSYSKNCLECIQKHFTTKEFDEQFLNSGPLDAAVIYDSSNCYLSIVWHHALYDGWSIDIIMQQLFMLIHDRRLTIVPQFEDYVQELESLRRLNYKNCISFWKKYLKDFKFKSLSYQREKMGVVELSSNISLLSVENICKQLQTTPLSFFLTAWSTVLSSYLKTNDFLVGTVVSGRVNSLLPNVDYVIGPCMQTLPVRIKLDDELSYKNLCQNLFKELSFVLKHSVMAISDFQEELLVSNLFESILIYQQSGIPSVDESFISLIHSTDHVEQPLLIEIEKNKGYKFKLTGYLSSELLNNLLNDFDKILNFILYNIESKIQTHASFNVTITEHNHVESKARTGFSKREEKLVRSCLSKILGNTVLSADVFENLQNYGFDSLCAMRFFSLLRKSSGIGNLKIPNMKSNPTIASLCELLVLPTETLSADNEITFYEVSDIQHEANLDIESFQYFPCTPMQQALLASSEKNGVEYYYNKYLFETGKSSQEEIYLLFKTLLNNLPILRTCFFVTRSKKYPYCQVVLNEPNFYFQVLPYKGESLSKYNLAEIPLLDSKKVPIQIFFLQGENKNYVLFCIHHVLYDAWAFQLIMDDINHLLRKENPKGSQSMLKFISYLHRYNKNVDLEIWSKIFLGFKPSKFPELCKDINPEQRTYKCNLSISLSQIDDLCNGFSFTTSTFLQCCWAKTLSFLLNSRDICFGNIISGRDVPVDEVVSLVAPTFNSFPLRVLLDSKLSFAEVCGQLQRLKETLQEHQMTSVQSICKSLTVKSLFDTVFIIQPQLLSDRTGPWKLLNESSSMDMRFIIELLLGSDDSPLTLVGTGTGKSGKLVCNLYKTILKHYVHYGLSTSVPLYTSLEKHNLISRSPSSPPPIHTNFDTNADIITLFEKEANEHPSSIALHFVYNVDKENIYSYKFFSEYSIKASYWLHSIGIKKNDVVAVFIDKSLDYYSLMLGVLRIGAFFFPLEHCSSLNFAKENLLRTNVKLLIVDKFLPFEDVNQVEIDKFRQVVDKLPTVEIPNESRSSAFIFPSYELAEGLTMMESSSFMDSIISFIDSTCFPSSSRWFQYAPSSTACQMFDCFMCWFFGCTLISGPQLFLKNNLKPLLLATHASHLITTSSIAASLKGEDIPSIQRLYCYEGPINNYMIKSWGSRLSYIYAFKPLICSCVPATEYLESNIMMVGIPLKGLIFAVVNSDTNTLAPIGSSGELCIASVKKSGNTMMDSQRVFTFENRSYYRTGDIVRILAGGEFEYIKKSRGNDYHHHHHLCMTSQICSEVMDIVNACFIKSSNSSKRFILFLALRFHSDYSSTRLHELIWKIKQLREFNDLTIETESFIFIDSMPLDIEGKINVDKLRDLLNDDNYIFKVDNDEFPKNDNILDGFQEKVILTISDFASIPFEKLSLNTKLSTIGIDSISAIQLSKDLREIFHLRISALDILNSSTINSLIRKLKRRRTESHTRNDKIHESIDQFFKDIRKQILIPQTLCDKIEQILPCLASQCSMLSRFYTNGGKDYLNYSVFHLQKYNDPLLLRSSWENVISNVSILRTKFQTTKHKRSPFCQVTYSKVDIPWSMELHAASVEKVLNEYLELQRRDLLQGKNVLPYSLIFVRTFSQETFLIIIMHHALYDESSLRKILGLVEKSLNSPIGKFNHEPIVRQIELLKANYEEAKAFWIKQLLSFQPTNFPSLTACRIDNEDRMLTKKPCALNYTNLTKWCNAHDVTLQVLGQLVWAKILASYCAENYAVFGTVLSGKSVLTDVDDNIFPTVTTIPCVVKLQGTVEDCLRQLQKFNLDANKFQFTSLLDIKKWLNLGPSEKLFSSLFSIYVDNDIPLKLFNDECKAQGFIEFPVALEMRFSESTSELTLNSAVNYIPQAHASLILDQFNAILTTIFNNPLQQIEILENSLPTQLLSIKPAIVGDYPTEIKYLHQFVEYFAQKSPNSCALEFALDINQDSVQLIRLTYSELNERANKLAHNLKSYGFRVGSIIAVYFDKCIEAFISMLAILKAGCCFLALDVSAPTERIRYIVTDSTAVLVMSTGELYTKLLNASINVTILDASDPGNYSNNIENPYTKDFEDSNLAYVLYTSGSTGKPKGCCLTHHNVVQCMLAFQDQFAGEWDTNSRFLAFASFHFDVSVLEQYFSWSTGITLVAAPQSLILQDLPTAISALKITHVDLTPSLASILTPKTAPLLRVFITGGEQIKQELLNIWGDTRVLYNFWGPTELTIGASAFRKVPKNAKVSNIGPPFPNCSTYILSKETKVPVLLGGLGEICMGGNQVAKGYLNLPEQTDAKFYFDRRFNDRIYHTGDLGRLLKDNNSLEFCGRTDDQIKLRGQRIEIGEINAVIKSSSEKILGVYTLAVVHPVLRKQQLVAFIHVKGISASHLIVHDHKDPSLIGFINSACKASLAKYMVPSFYVFISSVPLTPTNKFDKKKVIEEFSRLSLGQLSSFAPAREENDNEGSNVVEPKLLKIIADFSDVKVTDISPQTSVFELGLDSISAVALSGLLRKSGYDNANPSLILTSSTISNLGFALNTQTNEELEDSIKVNSIIKLPSCSQFPFHQYIELINPCLPLVEGLLFELERSNNENYYNSFFFLFEKREQADQFINNFKLLRKQYEVLRSSFLKSDGEYFQVVWKSDFIAEVDVLNNDSLIKTVRYSLKCEKGFFLVTVTLFHGIYDGWSLDLLLNDLARLCSRKTLAPRPRYSKIVRQLLINTSLKKDTKEYWLNLFRSKNIYVPIFQGKLDMAITLGHKLSISSAKLSTICRSVLKASVNSALLTSWICFLNSIGAINCVGIVVSGRSEISMDCLEVMGPLFNTIPFPLFLEKDESFDCLVRRCQLTLASMIPYHQTSLREIKKWLRRSELFNVLFTYNLHPSVIKQCEFPWSFSSESTDTGYPLALEIEEDVDGTMNLHLSSNFKYIGQTEIIGLLDSYDCYLSSLLETSNAKISSRPNVLMPNQPEVKQYIPNVWNDVLKKLITILSPKVIITKLDFERDTFVHEFGIDSIDLIWLASKVSEAGIGKLDIGLLMEKPTFYRILQLLCETSANHSTSLKHEFGTLNTLLSKYLTDQDAEDCYPATPIQSGLLLETMNQKNLYQNDVLFSLDAEISLEKLQNSWKRLCQKNAILRTHFAISEDSSEPMVIQIVDKFEARSCLNQIKILPSRFTNIEDTLRFLRHDEEAKRFLDPFKNPPYYVQFFEIGAKNYMFVQMHHSLYDGWSLSLMYDELMQLYRDEQGNSRKPFKDYIIQLYSLKYDYDFWFKYFENLSIPKPLPFLSNNGKFMSSMMSTVSLPSVRLACQLYGVSIQSLVFFTWGYYIASVLNCPDIVFHTVLSGRTYIEGAETVMGPCMNTIPVRIKFEGALQTLKKTSRMLINLAKQQHTPLSWIYKTYGNVAAIPMESILVYQHLPDSSQSETFLNVVTDNSAVDYPIAIQFEIQGDTLNWLTSLDLARVDGDVANQLLQTIDKIFSNLTKGSFEKLTFNFSNFVKYRQYQINLKDFRENLLLTEEAISDCDLLIIDERVLVVFILFPEPDAKFPYLVLNEEIIRMLKSYIKKFRLTLSSAMVPDILVPVSYLPRSLDHSENEGKLLNIYNSISADNLKILSAVHEIHLNETEKILLEGFSKIICLPQDSVDISNNFFQLGMDSIRSIHLCSYLRNKGLNVSVSDILQHSSIEKLAHYLQYEKKESSSSFDIASFQLDEYLNTLPSNIPINLVQKILPCSAGQMYALNAWYNTEKKKYFHTFFYTTEEKIELLKLKLAWAKLVKSSDILRTTFIRSSSPCYPLLQIVLKSFECPWEHYITDNLHDTCLKIQKRELVTNTTLQEVPLRIATIETSGKFVFCLTIHHALYDGWSLDIMINYLSKMYYDDSLTIVQQNSQLFLSTVLDPAVGLSRKKFWNNYLTNYKPYTFLEKPSASQEITLFFPKLFSLDTVYSSVRSRGLTVQSVSFAVFARLLANEVKQEDVVFGIYVSGRTLDVDNIDELLFPTFNVVPLRVTDTFRPLGEIALEIQSFLNEISGNLQYISLLDLPVHGMMDIAVNFLSTGDNNEPSKVFSVYPLKLNNAELKINEVETTIDGCEILFGNKPKLDFELAIRDGYLEIGLFCQSSIFSKREASVFINNFVTIIKEIEL